MYRCLGVWGAAPPPCPHFSLLRLIRKRRVSLRFSPSGTRILPGSARAPRRHWMQSADLPGCVLGGPGPSGQCLAAPSLCDDPRRWPEPPGFSHPPLLDSVAAARTRRVCSALFRSCRAEWGARRSAGLSAPDGPCAGPAAGAWLCCTASQAELAGTGLGGQDRPGLPEPGGWGGGKGGPPAPGAWVRTAPSGRCVPLLPFRKGFRADGDRELRGKQRSSRLSSWAGFPSRTVRARSASSPVAAAGPSPARERAVRAPAGDAPAAVAMGMETAVWRGSGDFLKSGF